MWPQPVGSDQANSATPRGGVLGMSSQEETTVQNALDRLHFSSSLEKPQRPPGGAGGSSKVENSPVLPTETAAATTRRRRKSRRDKPPFICLSHLNFQLPSPKDDKSTNLFLIS